MGKLRRFLPVVLYSILVISLLFGNWLPNAPTVVSAAATNMTAVSVTSSPAVPATGYVVGEVVQVTATFSAAETVTGTPTISINVGGNIRIAKYVSGSGSNQLVFAYTVVPGDVDTNGISIAANSLALNGGSINNGIDAARITHAAVADDNNDRIAAAVAALDTTVPVFHSASGAGSTITVFFDESGSGMREAPLPPIAAFTFSRNGGTGPQLAVTSVSINHTANTVTLGLNGLINLTDTNLRVSYTASGTNDIQDVAGNKIANLSNIFVANTMPSFDVKGNTLSFNSPSSIFGNGRTGGDRVLFSNIITVDGQSIDAIVTTTAITPGTTIAGYDTLAGTPTPALTTTPPEVDALWYKLNTNIGNAGGDITITFNFIKSGSYNAANLTATKGEDVILQNVAINSYDLDGADAGPTQFQYQEFGGYATYTVANNSALTQTQVGALTHFQTTTGGNVTSSPGTNAGDQIRVMALYDAIHQFQIKTGAIATGGAAYYYIDFSKGPNWFNPSLTYEIPTVNPKTTNDTTPEITGTFVGSALVNGAVSPTVQAYTLSVTVNGKTYTAGDGAGERTTLSNGDIQLLDATSGLRGVFNPTTGLGTWTLTVPPADALPLATYNVGVDVGYGTSLATISKHTLDNTTNELVINGTPADTTEPTFTSITRANPTGQNITSADLAIQNYVDFNVTFSEAVTNVDLTDFQITGAGSTGSVISSVTQTGPETFTVRVSNIPNTNTGILDLNLLATNDLVDLAGNLLSGTIDPVEGVNPTSGIDETYILGAPPVADLTLTKLVSSATPQVGSVVTFTLRVYNDGPSPATNVVLNDVVPTGYTYVPGSITGGTSRDDSTPTGAGLAWTIASIPSGGTVDVIYQALVLATGAYENYAEIQDSDQNDPNSTPGNGPQTPDEDDDFSRSVTPTPLVNVSLSKTPSPSVALFGDLVTFTIVVSNDGPSTATNIGVTDVVPSGYAYVAGSITGGTARDAADPAGAGLNWTIASLADEATATLSYQVRVNATGDFSNFAEVVQQAEEDVNSAPNNGDGLTPAEDDEAAAVAVQTSSLGDYVWDDRNGDGVQDSGENGIANVRVYLDLDNDSQYDANEPSDLSDVSGGYLIDGLAFGNYLVRVDPGTLPDATYAPTYDRDSTLNHATPVTLNSVDPLIDVDFGYRAVGTLSGHLYIDTNGDGDQDTGEPNLAGVDVVITDTTNTPQTVTTDANGNWQATVPPGAATVNVVDTDPQYPAGALQTEGDDPSDVTVVAGVDTPAGVDGYYNPSIVSGHLYLDTNGDGNQDAGEPDLASVNVIVTDSNSATHTVVTGADGNWVATVPPGSTTADVDGNDPQYPAGYTQTEGDDPTIITAVVDQTISAGNDGYYLPATVTGHLYIDSNGNGIQDPGEPDLSGVDVIVTDANGDTQTVTTDANGNWTATVPPGSTTAAVDETDPQYPAGYTQIEGDNPTTLTAVAGASTPAGNDGYYLAGTVSGHLYLDINGDGNQDPGEPNLADVSVIITDANGEQQTVTTDTNGSWTATVPPGSTIADVDESDPQYPAGTTQSEGDDPTTVTAVAGTDTSAGNDGYYLAGSISGHLYTDTNGNGIQDPGEPDLADVDVIVTDVNGNTQTVTTDTDGNWVATVPPGSTTADVSESDPQYPAGYSQTEGNDPTTITALSGQPVSAGNDGYYLPATVTGHLYVDTNGNGNQDPGEPNLAGVDVVITDSTGATQTVTTDTDGNWTATVPPGGTTANIDENDPQNPAGYTQTEGEDPTIVTAVAGQTTPAGDDGFFLPGTVSGHLYLDTNGNGTQDTGEPNLADVDVVITDASGIMQTVTTDINGNWSATVPPGSTTADVSETDPQYPAGYTQTEGSDPTIVTAVAGADTYAGNDGFYLAATVNGHLYFDTNGNGTQDPGEANLAGVDVIITDANGNTQTVTTDADGNWMVTVPPGTTVANVNESDPQYPAGYTQTEGTDPTSITAVAGQSTSAGNDGYYLPGTVSGHLYVDTNGDGNQDPGEPNLASVDVVITNANGATQTVTTDMDGNWTATVPPGLTVADISEGDPDYPAGYGQTEGDDPTTLTAAAGVDTPAGNDGYYLPATVHGHLYIDTNGNGTQDPGEPDLASVDVIVTDANGDNQTLTTDANGNWTATVPPGTTVADVDETDSDYPAGYTQTEGNDPTTVTAVAGENTPAGIDGYYLAASVSGHLYIDINGNGLQDPGEPDLANVDVIITDANGNTQTVTTDASGNWLATVPPGSATADVSENDPDYPAGYVQTEGNDPTTVTAVAGESTPAGNDGYHPTMVDLSLSKAVNNAAPNVGDTLTFTLTLTNDNPYSNTATNITVADVVPAGFTYLAGSITSDAGSTGAAITEDASAAPALAWTVDALDDGESVTFSYQVTVNSSGSYTNYAQVTATDQQDSDSSPDNGPQPQDEDDDDSLSLDPTPIADLSLVKSVDVRSPQIGDTITFTLTLSNAGPSAATNVEVTDVLPAGFSYVAGSISGGDTRNDADPAGTGLQWVVNSLANGASTQLSFQALVLGTGPYTNYAQVTGADQQDGDSTPDNGTGTPSEDDESLVNVQPEPGIDVEKTITNVSFITPTEFNATYVISITNTGGTTLNNIQVIDDLSVTFAKAKSYSVISLTSTKFTVNTNFNTVTNGVRDVKLITGSDKLLQGESGTIQLRVNVNTGGSASDYTNTSIASGEPETCPNLQTAAIEVDSIVATATCPPVDDSDTVEGPTLNDPAITKTADVEGAAIGDTVVYTITVTNQGNEPASNVKVVDALPAALDVIRAVSTPRGIVTITDRTVTVDLGTLNPGETITIKVTTRVNASANGVQIVNTAFLSTDSKGDIPSNNRGTTTVSVEKPELPATGFAPNVVTRLPEQPAFKGYTSAGELVLNIPALRVNTSIVGVPKVQNEWDVTWLGDQAGWLNETAFPTWTGNSVITGHVYLANGLPGPFVEIHTLRYGNQIIIEAYGQRYIYEIREVKTVLPDDTSSMKHEEKAWLTLVTCKGYDEKTGEYAMRTVVRAVLVKMEAGK